MRSASHFKISSAHYHRVMSPIIDVALKIETVKYFYILSKPRKLIFKNFHEKLWSNLKHNIDTKLLHRSTNLKTDIDSILKNYQF